MLRGDRVIITAKRTGLALSKILLKNSRSSLKILIDQNRQVFLFPDAERFERENVGRRHTERLDSDFSAIIVKIGKL